MKDIKKREPESPWTDEKTTRISITADKLLGLSGRMLYKSKGMTKPTTIFNANIFNSRAKKIWFGDIEIERDREALLKLSKRLGTIYILYEMDGRFLETMPTIAYIKAKAWVIIENRKISYSRDFAKRVKVLKNRQGKKDDRDIGSGFSRN